jgi:hypothetical protein
MMGPWHWVAWGVVLTSLMAGVLVTVLGRRLTGFWCFTNLTAVALYLGACTATLLSSIRLEQDVVAAGLQLAMALVILLLTTYRLHLVGVLVFVAGGSSMALFQALAVAGDEMTAQDMAILMLDVVTIGFLLVLWPYVHAELRHIGRVAHRYSLREVRLDAGE